MDRLHLISVLVAVVDCGSFAGAGRRLGLSAPAVTRAVGELESQLGVRLLTRTTRFVRVTEAGAQYARDCRHILADLAEADAAASGLHGTPRGRLAITAPVLFGAHFVAPIVTTYLERYPEVNASCRFLDRIVNLMEEGIDVAVRIGELPDSTLQATRVGRVRRVICASPGYLARHGTPRSPDELAAHVVVSASAVTPTPEWRLVDRGEPCTVKLRPRMTTTSNDSAIQAVTGGFGLTRLMSYQVADALRDGRLMTILEDFEPPLLPVHLLHREGRHETRKARAFLDLAIERLRGHPDLQ